MRVLFFGTSDFAVPSLERLAESPRHGVIAVVTQPDRPHGRGLRLQQSPVKRAALARGLPVLQPRRVRSPRFLEKARELRPDALALAAFGQIIPQELLDLPPFGPVNLHASLLPAYRGAAPIQHALLNGDTVTGVTTMWMDATLDTGDILLARQVPIEPEDDAGTLTEKLGRLGADLLLETLDLLEEGRCPRTPQDHSRATSAPAIGQDDARIRWEEPPRRIVGRVRAMAPRPGAFVSLGGRRVKVWRASEPQGLPAPGEPGTVAAVTREGVVVAAEGGAVVLEEVQPESGRRMPAADWARGARLAPGTRFDS